MINFYSYNNAKSQNLFGKVRNNLFLQIYETELLSKIYISNNYTCKQALIDDSTGFFYIQFYWHCRFYKHRDTKFSICHLMSQVK